MSEIVTLSCWVRGTPTSDILEIEVLPTQKVGSLQKLIKEMQANTFRDVDPSALRLYKPKDPVPEPYDESLRSVALSDLGKPLPSSRQLSKEFVWPLAEDHIHIIVDAPCPDILCWLRGANAENDFGGRIQSNATVSTLKEYIKEWNSELSDVPITRMKLFRISGDEEELQECLDSQGVGEFIKWNQLVSTCFADIPVLDSYCLVVEVSSPASQRSANRSGVGDSIKEARETYLRDVSKLPTGKGSPSAGSRPPSFRTRQRNLKTQIRCGRPRHPEETIPATLLHPVFGQFLDDSQTHVMTKEDNDFIEELANVMSDVYDTEQERVTKVYNVFRSHDINFNLGERVDGTDYVIDGAMSLDGHHYVIADFKNEAAASSSEPYMQCAAYYLESTKKQALKMTTSPLPCFLLVIFGPFMAFAGAVWNLRPDVQVLSTPLAFNYHSTDTHNQITAGRHVMAFRKAVRSLTQFYLQLVGESASTLSPPTLSSPERRPTLFPHCTSFTSLNDGSKKRFRYKEQPHDDKLVFFGTLLEDTEVAICIKFVRRYSREAHSLCASLGFAPKLRGFEQVPGGWFMVVMDKLVGYKLLADLCDSPDSHPPESVFEAISDQLKHLHLGGFVHGDIRDTNIMLKKDDQKQFMIIDFDWAGIIGEVRYPPYVNGTDIWRPEGAHDGELIQAGHDDAMLNAIATRHVIGE